MADLTLAAQDDQARKDRALRIWPPPASLKLFSDEAVVPAPLDRPTPQKEDEEK